MLQLQEGEFVTAMFPVQGEGDEGYLVLCTRSGIIKKTAVTEFRNIRKGGLIAQNLLRIPVGGKLSAREQEYAVTGVEDHVEVG